MNKKLCLYCRRRLVGRYGKKFCDNECRSSFHNKINRIEQEKTRKIDRTLKRNRFILEYQHANGTEVVDRKSLEHSGFDFDYFTHHLFSPDGNVYFFCYEFGYAPVLKEEGKYRIIKKKLRP